MITIVSLFIIELSIYLIMGFYVLLLNPKNKINITFFIITLCLAIMSYLCVLMQLFSDESKVILLYRIGSSFFVLIFTLIIFFSLMITNIIKFKKTVYIFMIIFQFYITYRIFTIPLFMNFIKYNGTWRLISILDQFGFHLVTGYWFISSSIYVLVMILWRIKSKSKREKKQAVILLCAFFLNSISNSIYIIFFFNIFKLIKYNIPGDTTFLFLIWIAGIGYCIVRYRLLSITSEYLNKEILTNINDSIILLDPNKKIITINKKTKELINNQNIEEGMDLSKIIYEYDSIDKEIVKMLEGKINSFTSRLNYFNNNEKIYIDARFSIIKDRFDDVLGILIIGKEIKELKQIKIFFKITDREVEIIQQIIEGWTNTEIARHLVVTDNTLKRHITNIYNKIGIDNKIELMNLLKDFNLVSEKKA